MLINQIYADKLTENHRSHAESINWRWATICQGITQDQWERKVDWLNASCGVSKTLDFSKNSMSDKSVIAARQSQATFPKVFVFLFAKAGSSTNPLCLWDQPLRSQIETGHNHASPLWNQNYIRHTPVLLIVVLPGTLINHYWVGIYPKTEHFGAQTLSDWE